VITPSHSYIATANAVRYCDATPVFVDIEPRGYNIDPSLIEDAITERTRAILCVHQIGMPCDLARIVSIGRRHGIPVIEDAACAIGSEIRWHGEWQRIGRPHGDIACFSFHPRKVISTGDGGMLTTQRADWDSRFRLLRQHAMSVSDTERHSAGRVIFESYPAVGFNYRMTDIQAAVGREQLKRLPTIVVRRRQLAQQYAQLLHDAEGLEPPEEPGSARSNWQSYCVRLPAHCDQRTVMQRLLDAGIATRRAVMCCHREEAYRDVPAVHALARSLARSERAQDHCILLPLFPDLTQQEQEHIVRALGEACAPAPANAGPQLAAHTMP